MEDNKDSGNDSGDHISHCYSVGIIGDHMADKVMEEVRKDETRCANCGVLPENAEKIITGGCMYEEEGEWVCSDECYNEYEEKGCPLEDGHYRVKKKEK